MSTAPTPPSNPTPTHAPMTGIPVSQGLLNQEAPESSKAKPVSWIRLVSHSTLFYWWPVWTLGFLFAALTAEENTRFLHVPNHTEIVKENGQYVVKPGPSVKDPAKFNAHLQDELDRESNRLHAMSHHPWMGSIFCFVLLMVIMITNVPLRGLWSVIVVITVTLLAFIFYTMSWWHSILTALKSLEIYIGFAGYLFIATTLFIMWAISTFIFDRQTYIIFTPGQMRVCEAVGAGENVYDTAGMQIEKHRTDWFRHILLGLGFIGLGTGDVTVKTSGAQAHTIDMKNVWRINTRLRQVEAMQRERQMVQV